MRKILITSIFVSICLFGSVQVTHAGLFSAIKSMFSAVVSGTQTVTCYNTCSKTFTKHVGTVILDLQCNASSPASYVGKLKVNTKDLAITKTCPKPTCAIKFNPGSLYIGDAGNATVSVSNDADATASCNCTGLNATGAINMKAGVYPQGPFSSEGTKTCTCTVNNGAGSGTCRGALTVLSKTPPTCAIQFSPSKLYIGQSGNATVTVTGDRDGVANCNCTGLNATGAVNLTSGNYPQGPFASAGTKTCTCTVNNSAGSGTCSGTLTSAFPTASCGTASSSTTSQVFPATNLCKTEIGTVSTAPLVKLDTTGKWSWGCKHNTYPNITATGCGVPSCLAGQPIRIQSGVYFDSDGEPNRAKVELNCPGNLDICCSVDHPLYIGETVVSEICTGQTGELIVNPGTTEYNAQCWFKNDPSVKVPKGPFYTNTICAERSCNGQNICQATPKNSSTASGCTSTCRSNADCSAGRMIETRP